MFDHLRFRGGEVDAASKTGEWTIERLDLNDPLVVQWREGFIGALKAIDAQLIWSKRIIEESTNQLSKAITAEEKNKAEEDLEQAKRNRQELEETLTKLLG